MKKKLFSLVLAAVMILMTIPFAAFAVSAEEDDGWDRATGKVTATADWYDAEAETLYIKSAADLMAFAAALKTSANNFTGITVKLEKNIDLNYGWTAGEVAEDGVITAPEAPSNVWGPITTKFYGTFDGQGHTISGIYMKATAVNSGIFGYAQGDATVENLAIVNSYLYLPKTSGGIFGNVTGSTGALIENVYADINIQAYVLDGETAVSQNLGGLVGYVQQGTLTIKNSVFAGAIDAKTETSKQAVGGLIGHVTTSKAEYITDVTLTNSAFYGKLVINASLSAALIGRVGGSGSSTLVGCTTVEVNNCVAAGRTQTYGSATTYIGSFFGSNYYNEETGSSITINRSLYTPVLIQSGEAKEFAYGSTNTGTAPVVLTDCAHIKNDADLTGLAAQKLLDDHKLTDYVATFGYVIPKTLDGIIPADAFILQAPEVAEPEEADIRFIGYQLSAVTDGRVNLRLVGVVDKDDLKYEAVGFRVVASYIDQAEGANTPSMDYPTSTVYTSLQGTEYGETVTYYPGDYSGDYFFALNCNRISTTLGKVTFRLSTFHVENGEKIFDADYEFTVDFSALES